MKIRRETPSDYNEVYELVKISFTATGESDGEWDYLNDLRKKDTFIPELSLIAEDDDGKITGQIVLYEMTIKGPKRDFTELLLSPVCVHPDYFGKGIARAMIEKSFDIAKEMGYKVVFLCGKPELYRRFGFKPTFEYNIFLVKDDSAEWCMCLELVKDALKGISGTIDII